ncbi:MAG TPA: hypothetical protein VF212_02720 [Longimicrobiales bacterium]
MSEREPMPTDRDVTFYDNFIPSLKDGQYTVEVGQTLKVDEDQTGRDGGRTDIPAEPGARVSQRFIVRGPRFAVDAADVHRVFPPRNGVGAYDAYLPMVVLNKRALPWERELRLPVDGADAYPWLALLVFTEDELLDPAPGGDGQSGGGAMVNPTRVATLPLDQVAVARVGGRPTKGPPAGTLGPTLTLEADEDPAAIQCNVIEISAETFAALVPSLEDLRYLAHVRRVSMEHKEPLASKHEGWYSVVLANRFAVPPAGPGAAGRRNIVHLVSLEGFEDYLRPDGPTRPDGFERVRLISLLGWSYTCLSDPRENFRELMLGLIGPPGGVRPDLLLRVRLAHDVPRPGGDVGEEVMDRLARGYVPLEYVTRSGERTFAWYRGPLSPVPTAQFLETTGAGAPDDDIAPRNASEALIYDPAAGLFDASYAVAFQTGRSLALADRPFATGVLQWRREAHALVDRLLELIRSPHLSGILRRDGLLDEAGMPTDAGVADLAALLDGAVITDAFKDFLATTFRETLAPTVGTAGAAGAVGAVGAGRVGGVGAADAADAADAAEGAAGAAGAASAAGGQDARGTATGAAAASVLPRPIVPAELAALMRRPPVVAMLRRLGGLEPNGETAAPAADGAAPATGASSAGAAPPGEGAAPSPGAATLPAQILEWLARTALLYGVPFHDLVADERLLPAESIRFFYVDRNWIDALLDGALSVGVQTGRDRLFHRIMRDPLHRAVDGVLHRVRDAQRGAASTETAASVPVSRGTLSGFLLRSAVVAGWPGLQVRAWSAADADRPMKPLRLDRVAPSVLLAIYPDVPVRLELNEPSEGLVFGVQDEGFELRRLPGTAGTTGATIGAAFEPRITLPRSSIPDRGAPAGAPALRVGGKGGLVEALRSLFPDPKPDLGPAALAVQLVRVPERMLFRTKEALDAADPT